MTTATPTPLSNWLASAGLTHQELASLIPCSRTMITLVANGTARPSWKLASRIEEVTNGAVSKKYWYQDKQEVFT